MFRWTICEPFNRDVVQKGLIERESIFKTFQTYPWQTELEKVKERPDEIEYSPSLEFINESDDSSIIFSIVEKGEGSEFMVFHIVTKTVKGFLGFGTKEVKDSSKIYLSQEKAEKVLRAFIDENTAELSEFFWI
jgi:hypothetical protein